MRIGAEVVQTDGTILVDEVNAFAQRLLIGRGSEGHFHARAVLIDGFHVLCAEMQIDLTGLIRGQAIDDRLNNGCWRESRSCE